MTVPAVLTACRPSAGQAAFARNTRAALAPGHCCPRLHRRAVGRNPSAAAARGAGLALGAAVPRAAGRPAAAGDGAAHRLAGAQRAARGRRRGRHAHLARRLQARALLPPPPLGRDGARASPRCPGLRTGARSRSAARQRARLPLRRLDGRAACRMAGRAVCSSRPCCPWPQAEMPALPYPTLYPMPARTGWTTWCLGRTGGWRRC